MPFGSIGSFHAMARGPAVMPLMNIAPVGITLLSSTTTSITISFTPPSGVVTGYVPFVNGVAGTGSGTPASYTITGLTAGQTYSIMMQATMSISGAVTNFLPTSIPGCLLWLDAADASTITYASGSSVSQWNDKSGNGYNFTAAAGTYPTYSSNAMSFVGTASAAAGATQYFSNSSIPFPNTYSIFVVAKGNASQPSIHGYNYIMKATTSVDSFLCFGSKLGNFATFVGPTSSSWNDTLINSPTISVTTNTILLGMTNDGATYLTPYANGTALTTKNGNASPFTGLTIGDTPGQYHGQCWNGTVNEILVFGSVLTNLQRQQVEGYLAWKWGIQTSLSASHPYYSTSGLTVSTITFSPRFIPGCALWFDAADTATIVKTGSSVSQWNDKSGNGYSVVQPTGANQPTHVANSLNGYGGIQLANTKYLYQVGSNMPLFSASSANSVYIVARNNSSQPYHGWGLINTLWFNIGGSTADTALKYHLSFGEGGTNGLRIYVGTGGSAYTGVGQSTAVAFGANAIVGFSMSSATTLLDVNGSYANYTGYIAQNNNLNNKWFIFGDSRGGYVVDMIIYEMIGFNTQLSISDQQQIDGYLASKWGIQSSLPTSHPFYSVPALTNSYSQFSPISIPGLKVWWDGADPAGTGIAPVNGASIATWVDKSGNGYNATASVAGTYSSSPVGVNFGTTGYYTTSYPANPTNESCFIVFNKSSNNQMMMIGTNTGGREVAMQNGTTFGMVNSGVGWGTTMSAGSATGVSHLGEAFVSGGTSTYVNFNGAVTLTGPTAVTAFTSGVLTNLGREGSASFQYLGYIQEILFYNSVLTLSQRQQVEGYLAWKWGIQTNLPVAHPYYSTSALASTVSTTMTYSSPGSVVKSLSTVANLPVFTNYNSVTTNGSYKIYAYTTVGSYSNAITMTGVSNLTIQIFAVGGGGSGGCDQAGGGGAGGVLQSSITVSGSDTVSLTVGGGGVALSSPNYSVSGANTTVSFTTNSGNNMTCYGGGGGASYVYGANLNGSGTAVANCGSGGGGSGYNLYAAGAGTAGQGYAGGTYGVQGVNGGGGGAGAVGVAGSGTTSGNGGDGIQINTTLLSYFAGSTYANYWWAGGGGGAGSLNGYYPGNGGKGGGGGGSSNSYAGGLGDTNGINTASSGAQGLNQNGGSAALNTGGGGGGSSQSGGRVGGNGGSGIILIAVRS